MSGTLSLDQFLHFFSQDYKQEQYESDLMLIGMHWIHINYTHTFIH